MRASSQFANIIRAEVAIIRAGSAIKRCRCIHAGSARTEILSTCVVVIAVNRGVDTVSISVVAAIGGAGIIVVAIFRRVSARTTLANIIRAQVCIRGAGRAVQRSANVKTSSTLAIIKGTGITIAAISWGVGANTGITGVISACIKVIAGYRRMLADTALASITGAKVAVIRTGVTVQRAG